MSGELLGVAVTATTRLPWLPQGQVPLKLQTTLSLAEARNQHFPFLMHSPWGVVLE